jgi:hypothetical protein
MTDGRRWRPSVMDLAGNGQPFFNNLDWF